MRETCDVVIVGAGPGGLAAACHAAEARCAGKCRNQPHADCRIEIGFIRRDDIESVGQQAVASQNGGCFIECLVHGRLAASQVVVVHGRQVVMDKRIAVNAFECGGNAQNGIPALAEEGSTFDNQKRPEALSAVQDTMAHGGEQPFWPGDFSCPQALVQKARQCHFHFHGAKVESGGEIGRQLFHGKGDGRKRRIGQLATSISTGFFI